LIAAAITVAVAVVAVAAVARQSWKVLAPFSPRIEDQDRSIDPSLTPFLQRQ